MNNIQSQFKKFLLLNTFFLILLSSCKDNKKEESQEEIPENEIALTKMQYKTIGIQTGNIENKNLNSSIKASGYTTVPPQNKADVSTLISGVIKDIYVLEGTYVSKGKVLATIQNLEVTKIQEDYQTAMANIEFLQLEYNRQKTLSDEDVNPKKTFQEVKSKLAIEKQKHKVQKINYRL
ncbi:efflux RND transporter periplasmic adaptor subunit [Flavobacterium oreochromis]|uniref:efflux RND transporter periplasmic adaptor subunit n=1 Tax=Flavobacterium oreochromis TaxID=2906078 RepID=UPI002164845D|nr:efflux RND transporter periplasmic adaptor subunit [Flavobacterium oreochromis]